MCKLGGLRHFSKLSHKDLAIKRCIRGLEKDRACYVVDGIAPPDRILQINDSSIETMATSLLERVYYCKIEDAYVQPPHVSQTVVQAALGRTRNKLLRKFGSRPTPISPADFSQMYEGRKRKIYEAAVEEYYTRGVKRSDAVSVMFVKLEKVKKAKAPRAIQPRGTVYNVAVGCYLKHIEHRIYRAIQKLFSSQTPIVMKGFNMDQVGEHLRGHWDHFVDPVAVGLDAKAFDQHVSASMLRFEHSFYLELYKNYKGTLPCLKTLLGWQVNNIGKGYAYDGKLSYKVKGRRFSGDMNTALGNCLIMCCMVYALSVERKVHTRLANNGDDCVVFMERKDLARFMHGLDSWFFKLGFRMTVESPVYSFEEIEFCQAHPISVGGGWRMVRNVNTAREKDSISLLKIDNCSAMSKWLGAVGECGLALCSGVPIMQEMYSAYMRHGTKGKVKNALVMQTGAAMMARGMAAKRSPISAETRVSFFLAFGFTPDEQVALEEYYRNWRAPACIESIEFLFEIQSSPF